MRATTSSRRATQILEVGVGAKASREVVQAGLKSDASLVSV
jgi:hypothetical protein